MTKATKCKKAILNVMRISLVITRYWPCQEISIDENGKSENTIIALIYKVQHNTMYTIKWGSGGTKPSIFICTFYPYVNA